MTDSIAVIETERSYANEVSVVVLGSLTRILLLCADHLALHV